ncbi:hypothetical protein MMC20_002907 [Loxospora ochrophaea]|nr:hypothetical protein [Loxospora ochrophaea]
MSGQQQQQQQQQRERESSRSQDEDWSKIEDQTERRKIQNRIAQRKFREKSKQRKEDEARIAENREVAGSSYAPPDADNLGPNTNPSGLPWGSLSIQHVVEAGRARERQSQQASREGSMHRGGGSRG